MDHVLSTETIWESVNFRSGEQLPEESRVDVCVIGAGIAGLTTAYNLAREGRRVLVLSASPVGAGMTSHTTAHLSNEIDDRVAEMERIHGADGARLAVAAHGAAIDFIEETVHREGIACDFRRVDGYLFAPPEQRDTLDEEEAATRRAGLLVERVPRVPWPDFDTGPALRFARQAQFHPLKYLDALAHRIEGMGGRICTGVRVTSVEDGDEVRVEAHQGQIVRCGAAVVATNSPINTLVAVHTKQAPYITYVICLEVPRDYVAAALCWDTLDPYHYVRTYHGGEAGGTVLIVGGEDHKTGQAHDQAERLTRLEDWARERFPRAGRLRRHWCGQVMETVDGLAYIGKSPGDRNVYLITGDSGMGMTHGTIAGLLLPDLILGRTNEWADLFDPGRVRAKSLAEYLRENVNAAAQYADYLTPGEVKSIDAVNPGDGAVVREGLTKLAVYRDEDGEVHACSAVCTHLGGIVHWNAAEKTWDCPLHGSRFDCKGKVIEGPASQDLKAAEPAHAK